MSAVHWVDMMFYTELLEAYGHDDKDDLNTQPQKLESELFSGPSKFVFYWLLLLLKMKRLEWHYARTLQGHFT